MSVLRRMGLIALPMVCCFGAAGCLAVEYPDGEATTFKNSWIAPLVLGGFGIAALVLGGGMIFESLRGMTPRKVKRKKGAPEPADGPSIKNIGGAIGGLVGLIVGACLLLLGAPSAMFAFITVAPDRVIIRDALFWFTESPREISFSSITGLDFAEEEVLARRGRRTKEYMLISHSGGHERIEMSVIHKAARPKLEDMYGKFRANPQAIAQNQPRPAADVQLPGADPNAVQNPGAQAEPPVAGEAGLTPIAQIGRFAAGTAVMVPRGGMFVRAEVVQVYRERKLKVRAGDDPSSPAEVIPLEGVTVAASASQPQPGEGPGIEIADDAVVEVGTKLVGYHEGRWYPVQVAAVGAGNTVVIEWIGEAAQQGVPKSWLRRVPDDEMQRLLAAGAGPAPRTGNVPASAKRPGSQPPGPVVTAQSQLFPGDQLLAEFGGQWLPVEVLEVHADGKVKIHWVGYEDSWDEVVERSKLRHPK